MNFRRAYFKALTIGAKISFHTKEKVGGIWDSWLSLLSIPEKTLVVNDAPHQYILFVGKEANFRALKFIKWLSLSGSHKIILAVHSTSNTASINSSYTDSIVYFRNAVHLKRMLKHSNLEKMVAFTSSPLYAKVALENFEGKKNIRPYDCLVVYYGLNPHLGWMKNEIPNEKVCFEKADAILARNLEAKQSLKMYGIKSPSNILYSDYCDNDNFSFNLKASLNLESEISLVYSGGLYGRSARSSSHGIENFDELISALVPNKIHLHLYPNPVSPTSYYYDFIEDAKTNPFLHVYPSIPQAQLGKELSNYTFGILPHFKDADSTILDYKLKYGTSNKFFNFLEAGIPIIVSDEMIYMAWLVKRYEIGIVISRKDLESLRSKIIDVDYIQLQENVKKVREKLSMQQNINRLNSFFAKDVVSALLVRFLNTQKLSTLRMFNKS